MSRPPPPPSAEFLGHVTGAQRSLYAFLTTLLWRAADVDDVLQETNLVLWRKAGEFDPTREFMPWALRIAQIQAMAHLKKLRRRPLCATELLETIANEAVAEADQADPRRLALRDCLRKLPERHRELIARRYEPGASVNALADASGKAPKAVSEMLRRIRHALLECIERTLAAEGAT